MRRRSWPVLLYSWLMWLVYPPSFRQRFGRELVSTFADQHSRHHRQRTGRTRFWWRTLSDLLGSALAEWGRVLLRGQSAQEERGSGRERRNLGRFRRDLRSALRMLARRPGYALPVIGTLALGIAANATVFSAVKSVFLDALPFPEADRLVSVQGLESATGAPDNVSLLDYHDLRAGSTALSGFAAWSQDQRTLLGVGRANALRVIRATSSLFELTGARVAQGRLLQAQDAPSAVVVLTHGFWQTRLGGDRAVIGRRLLLDGEPHEVVGVLARSYRFPDDADIALYAPLSARPWEARRNVRTLQVLARLRPGVPLATAERELRAQTERLASEYPATNREWSARLVPARAALVTSDRTLLPLYGAVSLLLLIGCANVSHLLLSRMLQRRRELALRLALGARRADLLSQLLAETLVLAAVAGAFGLAGTAAGVRLYRALVPSVLPGWNPVDIDGGVVLLTCGLSLASALLASLLPMWHMLRWPRADRHARSMALATKGTEARRAQRILVAVQLALATVLLSGALLLVQSFRNLLSVDRGFTAENVLSARIELRGERYNEDNWSRTFDELQRALAALPEIEAAGMVTTMPLNAAGTDYSVELYPTGGTFATPPEADLRVANGDYFQALSVRIVQGRVFQPADRAESLPVAVINQTLADRYYPGQDAVGRTLRVFDAGAPLRTIVGVVADVRHRALSAAPRPEIFLPIAQAPHNDVVLVLRTRTAPFDALETVRAAVATLDAGLPLTDIRTGADLLASSVAEPRFRTALLSGMAALALLLGALGVYALLAQATASRAYELAVRVALGARPRDVLLVVLGEAAALTTIGVLSGGLAALVLTRALRAALFEVQPTDARTYLLAAVLLTSCGLLASLVPARRALSIDPVRMLNR